MSEAVMLSEGRVHYRSAKPTIYCRFGERARSFMPNDIHGPRTTGQNRTFSLARVSDPRPHRVFQREHGLRLSLQIGQWHLLHRCKILQRRVWLQWVYWSSHSEELVNFDSVIITRSWRWYQSHTIKNQIWRTWPQASSESVPPTSVQTTSSSLSIC